MIAPQRLNSYVVAVPFRPFRIHTASGRMFEIRHPEVANLSRTTLTIYTALANLPDAEGPWYKLSLMLIEAIEPLDAPVHKSGE